MDRLVATFERILELLANSADSAWASADVDEIRRIFLVELDSYRTRGTLTPAGRREIRFMILPTGPLQEIAIDNGWGDEFCRLANDLDELV